MNINLKPLFTDNEQVFGASTDLTAVKFSDGLLVTGFEDNYYIQFGKISALVNNQPVSSSDRLGNAMFFYFDTATTENIMFEITRISTESVSYDLVVDRPYAKTLPRETYETLPESLRACYKLSKNKKPVTRVMTVTVRINDMVVNTVDTNFNTEFKSAGRQKINDLNVQSLLGVYVKDSSKLLNYLINVTPAFVTANDLLNYIKVRYETERPLFANSEPNDGEQFKLTVYSNQVHIDYYDEPYHREYEKVLATKRGGGYYADKRKVDRLIKPKPLRTIDWTPNTLYANDYKTLLGYIENIEKTLLLKK